ncbi:HD domain-containing protein [Streptomyces sp. MH60]|uniref:HD domain-containing protein n=1 Tax=Streptomyces sp. MH60 TaxID=1940758 RepID=UPI000CED8E76|nr:HD domain-containing protein [Streptomyces sp. MH60]PPS89475.1 GTP pyrophosphokinase [Streptomyces sp. MH60]
MELTVIQTYRLARDAHAGQADKIGVPYIEHVEAVAEGLAPFGKDLERAGLLHDIIEDTDWTAEALVKAGVPEHVVRIVEAVTNQPGVPYEEKIRRITKQRSAALVKVADNAHNSRPDRAAQLPEDKRQRLAEKYSKARELLWPAVGQLDVEMIVSIVNPALKRELADNVRTFWP